MRILIGLLLLICRPFHSSSKMNEHQGNQSDAPMTAINGPLSSCSLASSKSTSLSESSKGQYDDAVSGMSSQEEYDIFEKSMPGNLQKERTSRRSSRYPCNIERIDLRISREAADKSGEDYVETVITNLPDHPVIFVGYSDRNALLSRLASMDSLTSSSIGDSEVKLTSSNTYSSGLKAMTLKEYISYTVSESSRWDRASASASAQCDAARSTGPLGSDDSASCKRKSNESFYLFGGNFGGVWDSMRDAYRLPPCLVCAQCGAVTIGIGGHLSGVSFHHHGPGFSEVIEGSKRWFLFPPPSLLPLPLLPTSPDQSSDPDSDHDMDTYTDTDIDTDAHMDTHEGQCTIDGLISKRSRPGVDAGTRETRSRVREMFDPNMTVHEWVEQIYPSYVTHTHHIPSSTAVESAVSLDGPRTEPGVEQGQSNSSKCEMETCVGGEGMSVDRHSDTYSDSDRDSNRGRGRDRGRDRGRVEHSGGLQECTTGPGEMLYFPAQWMHATLNMSPYNVFVSLFIDLQLLR